MKKTLAVIVPTYNEKENVSLLVERVAAALAKVDYEILFVDDNSRDGTADEINKLAAKYPVRVMVRKDKRGLASAVVDGIKQSDSEFVIVMDADLQHPPAVLTPLFAALQTTDFVMGSRYAQGGSPGDWTLGRKIVSFVANLLALPLLPKVKDRVSGLFGFRRAALDVTTLSPVGWKIGLEIAVRGKYKTMTEVPYTFSPRARGASKLSRKIIWQYVQQLVNLYLAKYQILNFMIVGGLGFIVNILILNALIKWPPAPWFTVKGSFLGTEYYLLPFFLSSLVAIIFNYLLNKYWTFKGWTEKKLGGLRYFVMAGATLLLDMLALWAFVRFGKIPPVPAAALAILLVFIVRFLIARKWVWAEN
ncbi:MAG: glycosyltransferase family 2 protein [Dehalococcoidales bacterium]|nr:glycosyltransferase family 2 protein [Dehalococcoidales bacterium]